MPVVCLTSLASVLVGVLINKLPSAAPPMMMNSDGCSRSSMWPPAMRYPPTTEPMTTASPMIRNMASSVHPLGGGPPRQQRRRHFFRTSHPRRDHVGIEAAAGQAYELGVGGFR